MTPIATDELLRGYGPAECVNGLQSFGITPSCRSPSRYPNRFASAEA